MNLNFIQHPVPSASPSFFFLPFDFSTSQAPTPIASGPNPISQKIPKLTPISQKYHIPPITTTQSWFSTFLQTQEHQNAPNNTNNQNPPKTNPTRKEKPFKQSKFNNTH
jgi:hypothetical protein